MENPKMNWGAELWDQFDIVAKHTEKGIDFLEKFGQFVKERCQIEVEYASKLRKLVKRHQIQKKDDENYQYSTYQAFKMSLNEVNDMAGQHEVIAEDLNSNIIREVTMLVKDFREDRKKYIQDGAKMVESLQNQITTLEKSKKAYEKSFRESERALECFMRADADLNLSRADIEKHRQNKQQKSQQAEDAKHEYALQLNKTNTQQAQHYMSSLPEILRHLQELDEKRIKNIKNFMIQSVEIERNVFPIINKCLDGVVRAAEQIDEKKDTLLVIERYKSGFDIPPDVPFEDLSAVKTGDSQNMIIHNPIAAHRPKAMTIKGTISAGRVKNRGGILSFFASNKNNMSPYGENKEDFSELPPNQRKKKLQQRLEEIAQKISQETGARDGLMKMKGVYEQNPGLGDPMSVEGQLHESENKLDKLRQEQRKFQMYLEEAQDHNGSILNNSPSAPGRRFKSQNSSRFLNGSGHRHNRHSGGSEGEEESLSRSASDSSVSNPTTNNKQSAPGTPLPSHNSSHSPESGLGASHTSLPDSDEPEPSEIDGNGQPEYYDVDQLPALGICRALYPFDATSEGSIPMYDGEELHIIELDQGDGWTRVRRQRDSEEGFVPTSYIESTLFNNS